MTISYKPNKGNKRYWVILLFVLRAPSRRVWRVDFGVMENGVGFDACCFPFGVVRLRGSGWTGDFLNLSAEHPARRTKTMMPFASLIFSSFWCSISATRTGCFLLLFSSLFVLLSYDVPIGDSLCDHSDLRSAIPELPFREPPI